MGSQCYVLSSLPWYVLSLHWMLLKFPVYRTKIHVMKSIMTKNPVMPMTRLVEDVSGVYALQYQAHVTPLKLQIIYPQESSIVKNKGKNYYFLWEKYNRYYFPLHLQIL